MILGKKSDVKKHLSSKHPIFPHKVFVDNVPGEITGQMQAKEQSAEKTPPAKVEKPEDAPAKS
jgi:hypothetical protein